MSNGKNAEIKPTQDIYIAYLLSKKENWFVLKDIANIFYKAYNQINKNSTDDHAMLIKGKIKVESEVENFWMSDDVNTPKNRHDFHLLHSNDGINYLEGIEFQASSVDSKVPIPERSELYLMQNTAKVNKGTKVTGLWIFGKCSSAYNNGKAIIAYRREEIGDNLSGKPTPFEGKIIFVTLPLCIQQLQGEPKELAMFLKGCVHSSKDVESKRVKKIIDVFKCEIPNFIKEKRYINMLTKADLVRDEVRDELSAAYERKIAVYKQEATVYKQEAKEATKEINFLGDKVAILGTQLQSKDAENRELKAQLARLMQSQGHSTPEPEPPTPQKPNKNRGGDSR